MFNVHSTEKQSEETPTITLARHTCTSIRNNYDYIQWRTNSALAEIT